MQFVHPTLKITAAAYDASEDHLTVHATYGSMELRFMFCGNNFKVECLNGDVVDPWYVIPDMIQLLANETREDDHIAHVDAALRLAQQ